MGLPVSLRTRLTLLLALATLVALGIAARVVDWRADSEMLQRFDASLLARAQAFSALVRSSSNGIEIDAIADQMGRFPGASLNDWYLVTCHGQVVAQSEPPPPRIGAGRVPRYVNTRVVGGPELRAVALKFRPEPAYRESPPVAAPEAGPSMCELVYALDRGQLEDILRTLDWILVGSIMGACVLVLLLTPWLVRRGLRPLAALGRAMADIGPDAAGKRLPSGNSSELAPLVARFNEVLERMDSGLVRERQFASSLAHEVRTRLAELRMLVDVEMRFPSGDKTGGIIAEIGAIGTELEATVTALLQLTRIESGLEGVQHEVIDLDAILNRVIARHEKPRLARGLRLARNEPARPAPPIDTGGALLEIIIENLVGNAVVYAPEGSVINLITGKGFITISNLAPALTEDDLGCLGQRFWRKHDRDGGAFHAGLGLPLAAAAARAIGMHLDFKLREGELYATLAFGTT